MSFFSEKVLKRPPAEEVKGYSPRELEIAKKNYNYGHNVCFYTVMVCFIIWAILCSVFRPDIAHASELVGEDLAGKQFDNYVVTKQDDNSYCLYVNGSIEFNGNDSSGVWLLVTASYRVFQSLSEVESFLNTSSDLSDFRNWNGGRGNQTVIYSSSDIKYKDSDKVFFTQKLLDKGLLQVGGLTAPVMAKAIMIQVLGLVPLVLGLVVSAIGLRKALAMVFQRLRRA